jgi:TolA-binding protein
MQRTNDPKLQRELYYWMAESRKASEAYAEAARLYLKSAMLLDPKAGDPWGQTARYQAADALAHAGMVRDARVLFQQLLKTTTDPGRRAVLNRQLQKLWLNQ